MLRLLVPVGVCDPTHASQQVLLERLTHAQFSGTCFQLLPSCFQGICDGSNPASGSLAVTGIHLWYLAWLFVFTLLLYPLIRWLRGRGHRVLSWVGKVLALPGVNMRWRCPPCLLSDLCIFRLGSQSR